MIGDLENGLDLLRRGLALDPNLAWGWHFRSFGSAFAGEPEQAIEQATLSIRLSPQDPHMFAMHFALALGHFFARRFDDAARWAESGLRAQPRFLVGACAAAASSAMAGRSREADAAMRKVREINPGLNLSNLSGLVTIKKDDDVALWIEGLRRAGLPD